MGCNCGDNEFNIEIENNGSCEPTTPIYNISLGNVGVSGFSPKVNFVNETASGFQIQTIDINGEELSGVVPKLDYINSTFLTQADAAITYLTVNGSNAANPITINGIKLRSISGGKLLYTDNNFDSFAITTGLSNTAYLKFGNGFLELGDLNHKHIATVSQKAYYTSSRLDQGGSVTASEEIATVGDISDLSNTLAPVATSGNYEDLSNKPTIPTVGNGLIVVNQGGVTKGSFRLNQSEDYVLNLDAGGGGGSVSNPIVFTESSTETSGGTTTTTTGTLTLGLETTGSINPALKIHYKVEQSGEGGSGSFEWDDYIIDRTIPATNGGLVTTNNWSTGRFIRNMSINVDGSTLQINSSGQLEVKPNTFVQKSGDTMTGNLVISQADMSQALILKDTTITKGTAPSTSEYFNIINRDSADSTMSLISSGYLSNGGSYISVRAMKPQAGSSEYAELIVGYNSGGNPYAQAPTPAANSNNTQIATTAWVRTYGSSKQDTLTTGDAIDITSNVIGVKVDGTSITLNQNGELQSSGGVPSVIDGGNA